MGTLERVHPGHGKHPKPRCYVTSKKREETGKTPDVRYSYDVCTSLGTDPKPLNP